MRTEHPAPHHIPQLRSLWQTAFGDPDAFLDSFFRTAFFPDHCLCIQCDGQVLAALYWIDCECRDQKLAYIYAVATHPDHRGKGLCRALMTGTHSLLQSRGYFGSLLVPQQEGLRKMYAAMGYRNTGALSEFSCDAGTRPVCLHAVGPAEFARCRRALLPENSVLQEGAGLAFLAEQLLFLAGDGFLLAAYAEKDVLHGVELLGDAAAAPGILAALGLSRGEFRAPGSEKSFSMFHPLSESAVFPEYFGFAFD